MAAEIISWPITMKVCGGAGNWTHDPWVCIQRLSDTLFTAIWAWLYIFSLHKKGHLKNIFHRFRWANIKVCYLDLQYFCYMCKIFRISVTAQLPKGLYPSVNECTLLPQFTYSETGPAWPAKQKWTTVNFMRSYVHSHNQCTQQ